MDYPRPCGCKGCRTCLICEQEYGIQKRNIISQQNNEKDSYSFCAKCNLIYPGWNVNTIEQEHPNHRGEIGINYPGFFVINDFISEEEELDLMNHIDDVPWDMSQSGRRKQNYGPKANFKKKKIVSGNFNGFPKFSQFLQERFQEIPLLHGFQTIEQCSLEYTSERGASIDPHIDDCWVWGERILTVNLLSDSVLTMNRYMGANTRYNLESVDSYKSSLLTGLFNEEELKFYDNKIIRIPMPRRSLIILYGPPRYQWEHSVLREDINARRVCIAYREFTPDFLPDGAMHAKTEEVLRKATNFWEIEKVNI